jgi:hypothetical protein
MNNNELGQNNSKNTLTDALQDTILDKIESMRKDTLETKSSISQAQNYSNSKRFNDICQLSSFLTNLDSKTKVKVKILDFESFRQFLSLCNKYSTKFVTFKYETDFEIISVSNQKGLIKETITFKESFSNWLKNQKIDPKITEILQKEVE